MICRRCGSHFFSKDRWANVQTSHWGLYSADFFFLCSGCHRQLEEWISAYHGPPLNPAPIPEPPFACHDRRLEYS